MAHMACHTWHTQLSWTEKQQWRLKARLSVALTKLLWWMLKGVGLGSL